MYPLLSEYLRRAAAARAQAVQMLKAAEKMRAAQQANLLQGNLLLQANLLLQVNLLLQGSEEGREDQNQNRDCQAQWRHSQAARAPCSPLRWW